MRTTPSQQRPVQAVHPSRALAAAVLAALALPASAAGGSLLELYVGPHQTEWLELKTLRVVLDGAELPVTPPAQGADPSQPVLSTAVSPGPHDLRVEAGLDGDSDVFTYVDGYRFTMRGQVGLQAPAAEVVAVQASVTSTPGVTVRWTDRYRLALRATHYPSDRAAAAEAPTAAPAEPMVTVQPHAAPAPAAATAVAAASPAAPATRGCSLGPVNFEFDKSDLTDAARAALDRFGACLAGGSGAVRLEGHADPQGPADYNEWLGEQRAKAAAAYLRSKGIAASRLVVVTLGATRPLCTAYNPACNSRNRRVEAVSAD